MLFQDDAHIEAKFTAINSKLPISKIQIPPWQTDGRWEKWIATLQESINEHCPRVDDIVWNFVARCWDFKTGDLYRGLQTFREDPWYGYPDLNAEKTNSIGFLDRNLAQKLLDMINLPDRLKQALKAQQEILMKEAPDLRRKLRTSEILLTMFNFADVDHGKREERAWERFNSLIWLGDPSSQMMKFRDATRECFEYLTEETVAAKMRTRILPHIEKQWKKSKLFDVDVYLWDKMGLDDPLRSIHFIMNTLDSAIEMNRRTEAVRFQDAQED